MFCTAKIKLLTTPEQHEKLLKTMKIFNEACNYISKIAFETKTFGQIKLHKLCYYDVREKFGLSAQLAVRAIGKVSETYKADKKTFHVFREHGAVVYDNRILSFKGLEKVSLVTVEGRIEVPIVVSAYHKGIIQGRRVRGQADLILENGTFYLLLVVEIPEPDPFEPEGWIGVDLGIKNIATDSTGEVFSGGHVNNMRKRHLRLRAKLQSKGTKSAKRLLKKRSKKERRFVTNVNHVISKRLVEKALRHRCEIALEDLKGIRQRTTVAKSQRALHHSWAFRQLVDFIVYKAKLAGVPVVFVDPKNTSRTCPKCGHVAKENRVNRDWFCCQACGHADYADNVAACNIARRAAVIRPNAVA